MISTLISLSPQAAAATNLVSGEAASWYLNRVTMEAVAPTTANMINFTAAVGGERARINLKKVLQAQLNFLAEVAMLSNEFEHEANDLNVEGDEGIGDDECN